MYVPPFNGLLKRLGTSREEFENAQSVRVSADLFKFLLQIALANSDFNETGYLRANPDVAGAVKSGEIGTARLHYIGFGYFEGRMGAVTEVDEKWYLSTYSDVAAAVRAKRVSSGAEHFHLVGAAEGRSPNAHEQATAVEWKKVLVGQ